MRYANYKYHGQNINNLGDHAQVMTIDYLYSQMGIEKEDIIYIDISELKTYDGPKVRLPVSLPLINYSNNGIADMFSDNIEPVFFGLTMPRTELYDDEVEYYKLHEPIGCRDEQAYNTMKKYGIDAYLGGCLTVALPKREDNPEKQNKIFIVDIPEGLKEFIPQELKKNAIWDTHIFYDYIENPTEFARERYEEYKETAKLMITGLLHGSIPCMAFGIPVVLARDYLSYRFAWTEALLPVYTTEEYSKIDWNPKSVDIEKHKSFINSLFMKRMIGEDASSEIEYLNKLYLNRTKKIYMNDVFISIQNFIDNTWKNKNYPYEYAVWGLTQMAEMTINYIAERFPNAKLTHIYDKNTQLSLRGIQAISPDNIVESPNEVVIVTTVSAEFAAKKLFTEINKNEDKYHILRIIR